jgi:hypothetical protein
LSHLQSLGANPVGAMHKLKGMKRYRAGYSDLTTFDYLTAQQYETGAGARSREERALALIMTPEVVRRFLDSGLCWDVIQVVIMHMIDGKFTG